MTAAALEIELAKTYPNRRIKPQISTTMPTKAHPSSTRRIPPKKSAEPFALCHWKKKTNVRVMPITNVRPAMNRS